MTCDKNEVRSQKSEENLPSMSSVILGLACFSAAEGSLQLLVRFSNVRPTTEVLRCAQHDSEAEAILLTSGFRPLTPDPYALTDFKTFSNPSRHSRVLSILFPSGRK